MNEANFNKLLLFTQGYAGEQLVEKLAERGIKATVYTYAADASRSRSSKQYLRGGYPIRYIKERSFDPMRIRINSDDLVICFDWTKDFFHELKPEAPVYHIHPSLLPAFRGYGAVSEQFLRGIVLSGATLYKDNGHIDAGDILFQERIRIELHHYPIDFLDSVTSLAEEWIERMLADEIPEPHSQKHEQASYVQRKRQKQGLIDWEASALYVYNTVRAYSAPYFGSYYWDQGVKTTVWRAICEKWAGIYGEPGEKLDNGDDLEIACGEGTIILSSLNRLG